ncbi:ribonuclease H-like domain-containing protein [Tanacetum coccineum]
MVTRFRVGTNRPTQCFNLHVSTISPIPKSYPIAFRDPNWYRAMLDEYTALIKNNTWILVPRPPDANIVRSIDCYHAPTPGFRRSATSRESCLPSQIFSLWLKRPLGPGFRDLQAYVLRWVSHSRCDSSLLSTDRMETLLTCFYISSPLTDLGSLNISWHFCDSLMLFRGSSKLSAVVLLLSVVLISQPRPGPYSISLTRDPDISYAVSATVCLIYAWNLPREPSSHFSQVDLTLGGFVPTTHRSSSGVIVFFLATIFSWSSKRQFTLSRSSAEAEYGVLPMRCC